MKKKILLSLLCYFPVIAFAADLVEVYKQALISDATFQQAIAQRLATKQGVPISVAQILPQINFTAVPSITKSNLSGSKVQINPSTGQLLTAGTTTTRAYVLTLTTTQTLFNFAQFSGIAEALANSKGADATLNAALQNLMIRTANAYFTVLRDEDNLSYSEATKLAFKEQLDQIKQQYQVGLKTITDVYTAQASYDTSVANYIGAQTTLNNDRENLRLITGVYYSHLSTLSEDFPLLTPEPSNVEEWVRIAQAQNWNIKAAQHAVDAAREVIHQQFAGHLPTINAEGIVDKQYTNTINNSMIVPSGAGVQVDRTFELNIDVPVFAGGGVVASTNQASYNYEVAEQQLEGTIRNTINVARQSYQSIMAGRSKVGADKQAIKSSISSLQGMQESYRVGTQTLVDVLNQQQNVFQAETQYATDRYAFVNNVLALKQAAGTLSFDDLCAINSWLTDKPKKPITRKVNLFGYPNYNANPLLSEKKVQKKIIVGDLKRKETVHQTVSD